MAVSKSPEAEDRYRTPKKGLSDNTSILDVSRFHATQLICSRKLTEYFTNAHEHQTWQAFELFSFDVPSLIQHITT